MSAYRPYGANWTAVAKPPETSDPRGEVYSLPGIVDVGIKYNYSKEVKADFGKLTTALFGHVLFSIRGWT